MRKHIINAVLVACFVVAAIGMYWTLTSSSGPKKAPISAAEKKAATPILSEEKDNTLTRPPSTFSTIEFDNDPSDDWWDSAVIYQIWVRSFHDSDGDGNGDLKGITQKLPYLNELGVQALWLSPIFESPSYHGYNATDFFTIDEAYGSEDDLKELTEEANKLNIKIVLDFVINNVSDQHPWFQKSLEKIPPYTNYFVWEDTMPENYGQAWSEEENSSAVWHSKEGREGFYYGVFGWGNPDLNLTNPAVVAEIKNALSHWLSIGINGFRFDAIRYLIENGGIEGQRDTTETLELWQELSAFIKAKNPNAFLIGESFSDSETVAKYYLQGNGIDAGFDFSLANEIGDIFDIQHSSKSMNKEKQKEFFSSAKKVLWQLIERRNSQTAPYDFFFPFINNHDADRVNTRFDQDFNRAKLAASILMLLPGSPVIYYGEEIAMTQNAVGDDIYRRAIMQWNDSEYADFNNSGNLWLDKNWFPWLDTYKPWWNDYWKYLENKSLFTVAYQRNSEDSVLRHYANLISVRKQHTPIRTPDKIDLFDDTGRVWISKHSHDDSHALVLINLDADGESSTAIPTQLKGNYTNVVTGTLVALSNTLLLAPGTTLVLMPN